MMTIQCDTDQFWDAMCNPAFVRTSITTGSVGSTEYVVDVPPEHVPGFIDGKLAPVIDFLKDADRDAPLFAAIAAAAVFGGLAAIFYFGLWLLLTLPG